MDSVKIKENLEDAASRTVPEWLELDLTNHTGKVKAVTDSGTN